VIADFFMPMQNFSFGLHGFVVPVVLRRWTMRHFRRKSPLLFANSSLFFEESPLLFFESRGGGEKARWGGGEKGGK
jgi:hypothetical protein